MFIIIIIFIIITISDIEKIQRCPKHAYLD